MELDNNSAEMGDSSTEGQYEYYDTVGLHGVHAGYLHSVTANLNRPRPIA